MFVIVNNALMEIFMKLQFNPLPYLTLKVKELRHVQLFATPWTVAYQAPASMGSFQARVLKWVVISFSKAYLNAYNYYVLSALGYRLYEQQQPMNRNS